MDPKKTLSWFITEDNSKPQRKTEPSKTTTLNTERSPKKILGHIKFLLFAD